MIKKKIAICYFTDYTELKFLNESLRCLAATIKRHPEYEVKTFIFDDENAEVKIIKKDIVYPVDIFITNFKRNTTFSGFDTISGIFEALKNLQNDFHYDYLVKLDAMTCLNCLDSFFMIEEEITNNGKLPVPLGYFTNFYPGGHPCPYWQNYNKTAITLLADVCKFADTERGESLKKQIDAVSGENIVAVNILHELPVYVVDTNYIYNLKGCCNPFIQLVENYFEYSAVSFRCIPSKHNYEIAYREMKKHVDSII
jgi:hypothetical protein